IAGFGRVVRTIDTNVRAENGDASAFVDLIAIGEGYPLFGSVGSPQVPAGSPLSEFLAPRDGLAGTLVDPLMLDELGATVGDANTIGGTPFEAGGELTALPDAAVRGFRLGVPAVITIDGLATLGDVTSPLPGRGTWFRYKVALSEHDAET